MAVVRELNCARAENEEFHAEECSQSKMKFFSFGHESTIAMKRISWERFRFPGSQLAPGIDALPPTPFGSSDLALVSKSPIFSAEDCSAIIQEAEDHRTWQGAERLASYATNASVFCPVRELPRAARWLDQQLENVIYPAIAQAFPYDDLNMHHLRCSAASIVKYNATAGQNSLGVHRDGPLIAATIPLNGLGEYDGGGTYIEALHSSPSSGHYEGVIRRDTGHLILHPATLRHGGAPITRGLRYILVCWVFSEQHVPHGHYSTQRASRFLAAALRIHPASGSAYRRDLLAAAADGFGEALRLGAGESTESAHVGLGQALLEMASDRSEVEDMVQMAQKNLMEALEKAPRNSHAAALLARAQNYWLRAGSSR